MIAVVTLVYRHTELIAALKRRTAQRDANVHAKPVASRGNALQLHGKLA